MHFESTSTLTARGLKLPSVHRARGCYAVAPKQVTGACAEQGQSRGRAGAEQGQSSLAALPGLLLRVGLHFTGLHFKGLRLQGVANSRGCEFKGLHLHCRGWPRTAVPTWLSPCTAAPRGAWRPCSPRSCSRRPLRCPATPRSCSRRPLRCPAAGHGERSRLYLLYQFGCSSRLTGVF